MPKNQVIVGAVVLAIFLPSLVFAASNDAQISPNVTITVGGYNLTVNGSNALLESMVVNASDFELGLSAGSQVTISSADRRTLTVSGISESYITRSCNSSTSDVGIVVPLGAGSTVITATITPTSNACSSSSNASSGSGGGGGGGGGGGSVLPSPSTVTAYPTPTLVPGCPAGMICKPINNTVPAGMSAVFTKRLVQGSQSGDVTRLQTLLASDPTIYPEGKVTGYFGPLTRKAVQNFQVKYKIAAPGVEGYGDVGPMTRAALQKVFGK